MPPIGDIVNILLLFATLYFEVFLIVTYLEERPSFRPSTRQNGLPPTASPSVTIMVPAWNEETTLQRTVDSLLALDYPKDKLSIFIIDDGSSDRTLEVARAYERHPGVRVFHKENGGKHTAMNLGLSHCTSDLVGCLDADSFVDRAALQEIVPLFSDEEVMAVTPSVQIHDPDNPLRRMQSTEYMIGQFTRKVFSRFNGLYVTPGPFSIYRRSIFDRIGGFVHGFNTEDMEMAMRMQSHRMRIENAHAALVYTVSPRTPYALYKQRVRWVSGFLKNAFFSYRFMFLNPKYGNLGMLTLPFAFVSIFIALYFIALYLHSLGRAAYEAYIRYSVVGFHLDFGWPRFDWFAINLEFQRLLIYLLFGITIFFIIRGIMIVKRRFVLSRDLFYFLALYGLIAPFWLVRSLVNLVAAKDAPWR